MAGKGQSTLARRVWARALALTGITLAVTYSWWSKVEAARQPGGVPAVEFGKPVDLGMVQLTPLSLSAGPGNRRSLRLHARIENVTSATQNEPFGIPPQLPEARIGSERLLPPTLTLDQDNAPLSQVHPRLPKQVTFEWSLPPTTPPAPLTVTFRGQVFKAQGNVSGGPTWLGPVIAGQLTTNLPESPE